jgi:hypothetical protein
MRRSSCSSLCSCTAASSSSSVANTRTGSIAIGPDDIQAIPARPASSFDTHVQRLRKRRFISVTTERCECTRRAPASSKPSCTAATKRACSVRRSNSAGLQARPTPRPRTPRHS